jgi:hypothetical protein
LSEFPITPAGKFFRWKNLLLTREQLVSHKIVSCGECLDSYQADDGSGCSACCEHWEHDHGICFDCGKDCTDDLVGRAEAAFEGER